MNSGRLLSIMATVSPLFTPSLASPPAIRWTRSRSSFQLIDVRVVLGPDRDVVAQALDRA